MLKKKSLWQQATTLEETRPGKQQQRAKRGALQTRGELSFAQPRTGPWSVCWNQEN